MWQSQHGAHLQLDTGSDCKESKIGQIIGIIEGHTLLSWRLSASCPVAGSLLGFHMDLVI